MALLLEAVRSRVRRALVARSPGVDLSRLDRVPERLTWPLKRDGIEPVDRVLELREAKGPVAKVVTFLGVEVWVVTGDAEVRELLADQTSYSTDIRPYMGKAGDSDIGGLGFTDPPDHTRLRKLLTPEFTMRRLARLKPAIERIIEDQLDETGPDGRRRLNGRPGPDVRLPGAVPRHLRAAGPAARRAREVPLDGQRPVRRDRRRHRHRRRGGRLATVPVRGDGPAAPRPRARSDRPDHPRARRRDHRLRPGRPRGRRVHRRPRDQRLHARSSARPCCSNAPTCGSA